MKLEISTEAKNKFTEHESFSQLRDRYILLRRLSHKLAAKYAIKSIQSRKEFWRMVRVEHPEHSEKELEYNPLTEELTIKE